MKIIVNGKTEHVSENLSIKDFLRKKKAASEQVVIELNRNIVKKDEHRKTLLREEDQLEIIRIVGGG